MSSRLRARGWRRVVAAQLTIDESTALAVARTDPDEGETAFWVAGITIYLLWNLGTLLGAFAGSQIADPSKLGLDAAFAAAFLALVIPLLRESTSRRAAALAATVALVAVPLTRPGIPILLAAPAAAAALVGSKRRR